MPSRPVKATLAMVPVLAGAAALLWFMYAPTGYRYEFEVASRTSLDSAPQTEQHWRGVGGDRAGGALFFKANESALMTERAGVMTLLADTSRWVREHSSFSEHQNIDVVDENVRVQGFDTQQRLVTSDDTLFITGHPPAVADAEWGVSAEGTAGASASASADAGASAGGGATVRARRATKRVHRAADREKRFVRATHTETYLWTTDDIDPRIGRAFERFADSLVMLASHRSPRAIHSKHQGQDGGPYRGVALRVVSTAVTVDSLGRRREIVTRAEIRDLRRDRNAVAYVHHRKVEGLDRQLSESPDLAPLAPVAPAAPAAALAAPAPLAAPRP